MRCAFKVMNSIRATCRRVIVLQKLEPATSPLSFISLIIQSVARRQRLIIIIILFRNHGLLRLQRRKRSQWVIIVITIPFRDQGLWRRQLRSRRAVATLRLEEISSIRITGIIQMSSRVITPNTLGRAGFSRVCIYVVA